MKRMIWILSFFVLCLTAAFAAADAAFAARTAKVFSTPGGTQLGQVYAGTELTADAEQNGFRRIRLAGLTGFVEAAAITSVKERDETRDARVLSPYGTETIVLRSAPSGSCSTVGILRTGEKVCLLGQFGGFRYVRSPAGAGFLSSEEIK